MILNVKKERYLRWNDRNAYEKSIHVQNLEKSGL